MCIFWSNRFLPTTKIVRTIKSLTAHRIRGVHPEIRELLWGGQFLSLGYFIATVDRHASEDVIQRYVKHQGEQESPLATERAPVQFIV
ncbi:MAG TPA: transposase [Rhodothermales bacterium]|nr:transposase [Rhodothermales bacterium]